MSADSVLDIFHLSRIGAEAEHDGHRLLSRIGRPAGPGVCISSQCQGETLTFWVPEADWCAWLAPQLALSSAEYVPDELRPLLAAWTLAPLHDFLQAQGLPGFSSAECKAALAPDSDNWCIKVQMGNHCLPLYLVNTPVEWRRSALATFSPNPEQIHELGLGLGWCILPERDWSQVCVGDALPLHGMTNSLDSFWLHPAVSPGRIRLLEADHAVVDDDSKGVFDVPPDTLCLAVEAARAVITADELARWTLGRQITLQTTALPVLKLTSDKGLVAVGQLLQLEEKWAVQICA
ncbi:hypothetical protein BLA50215_07860 [Burkholderia lata]|uniref:hypothetical protein n=1 Tax=Burkholderia lata (strain ATCC 17760 / DSM 23089 / LMG 22485 / NCIMB 9086 / R18194 / 383) TaxID=482957 RepID=UPI0014531638|nr:hypothetical protein [Burkholderia lata]VWD64453.1 hypothetical protein BLA50215_07860 [Burkholderia lata]